MAPFNQRSPSPAGSTSQRPGLLGRIKNRFSSSPSTSPNGFLTPEPTESSVVSPLTSTSKINTSATVSTRSSSASFVVVSPVGTCAPPTPPEQRLRALSTWEKALEKLSPEECESLGIHEPSKLDRLDVLTAVVTATKQKRDLCIQRRWSFTYKGEEVVLRDKTDKIIAWIDKFKTIGDITAQYDPAHFAFPWAGIRFLLQV
ncbi:hypothetical protein K440DRAFT_104393 [Wilcoxina mikolae CBS 423.85]|nr:hypothetical protein K440DRAFT_104393 [Wilcoxina mikolae CBS 423.85]